MTSQPPRDRGAPRRRRVAAKPGPTAAAAVAVPADWPTDDHRHLADVVSRIPPAYLAGRGPGGAATRYVAHPERPETCVCGWSVSTTLDDEDHDRAHQTYRARLYHPWPPIDQDAVGVVERAARRDGVFRDAPVPGAYPWNEPRRRESARTPPAPPASLAAIGAAPPPHVLSDEQNAIVGAAREGRSFKVPAFAGCAKTYTVEEIAAAIAPRPFLYIAYNNNMAAEARRKMRRFSHVTVSTFHALAFAELGRGYGDRMETRVLAIQERIASDYTAELMQLGSSVPKVASAVLRTIQAYQNTADVAIGAHHVPRDVRVAASSEAIAELAHTVFEAMTSPDGDFPLTHDTYAKQWQISLPRLDAIYSAIAVDEAQDSNPVMVAVVRDQQCQQFWFGDTHQSLYGFRSAVNALEGLPLEELPLTQTWRFGDKLANFANAVLDVLGEKRTLRGNPNVDSRVVITPDPDTVPDMIIARTNAGVFEQALALVDGGRRVDVLGGVDDLLEMVLGAYELSVHGRSTHQAFRFFRRWDDLVEASKGANGAEYAPFVRLVDRHGTTLPAGCARIRGGVGRAGAGAVALGTTHKAKGLEWDLLRFAGDFIPFCAYDPNIREIVFRDDEARIAYVALTRGKLLVELGPFAAILMSSLALARRIGRGTAMRPFDRQRQAQLEHVAQEAQR